MTKLSKRERAAWRRLMAAWNRGNYACLYELARRYTHAYPENGFGWCALAGALRAFARYDEARATLRRAERHLPETRRAVVWAQLGHLFSAKGNCRRAEHWYRRAADTRPSTRNLVFLGELLAQQGRTADAKRCHRRAIRLATECPAEAHFELGLVLRAEGRYEHAIESFDRALALDARYREAKTARHDCLQALSLKRPANARSKLPGARGRKAWQRRLWAASDRGEYACLYELARRYTHAYPKGRLGWILLAEALAALARYDEARAALRRVEPHIPEPHRAELIWARLGMLYREKGDYRRAEHWYRRAADARPTTSILVLLGAAFARQGRAADAKRCHRRAIRLATECPDEAHFNLGLLLRAEGRYERAIESFDRAIALDPRYRAAKKARRDCVQALALRRAG